MANTLVVRRAVTFAFLKEKGVRKGAKGKIKNI